MRKKSGDVLGIIDFLVSISQYLPEIKKPEKEVPFKQRMLWTIVAVLIFFILGQIMLVGLSDQTIQQFGFFNNLASEIGTITAGIGPIVTHQSFYNYLDTINQNDYTP